MKMLKKYNKNYLILLFFLPFFPFILFLQEGQQPQTLGAEKTLKKQVIKKEDKTKAMESSSLLVV